MKGRFFLLHKDLYQDQAKILLIFYKVRQKK